MSGQKIITGLQEAIVMTDDLVTRLKDGFAIRTVIGGYAPDIAGTVQIMAEAAARIESDAATIERLTAERDEYMRMMRLERVIADKNADKATTAEAKLAALVEACEALREGYGANYIDADTWEAVTAFADAAVTAAKGAK